MKPELPESHQNVENEDDGGDVINIQLQSVSLAAPVDYGIKTVEDVADEQLKEKLSPANIHVNLEESRNVDETDQINMNKFEVPMVEINDFIE